MTFQPSRGDDHLIQCGPKINPPPRAHIALLAAAPVRLVNIKVDLIQFIINLIFVSLSFACRINVRLASYPHSQGGARIEL